MIKVILWDIDGTLLDFAAAERTGMKNCFQALGLGSVSEAALDRFAAINQKYWQMLERGEIAKQKLLIERFREFFETEGIPCPDAAAYHDRYELELAETIYFRDDAYSLIQSLRGRVKQYVVTNGLVPTQRRKLEKSGLGELFDGVFISDLIGADKPAAAFFDHVFAHIGDYAKEEVLIVGDSPTSDMRGGNNAGIRCCWYAPNGGVLPEGIQAEQVIQNLWQVVPLFIEEEGGSSQ